MNDDLIEAIELFSKQYPYEVIAAINRIDSSKTEFFATVSGNGIYHVDIHLKSVFKAL